MPRFSSSISVGSLSCCAQAGQSAHCPHTSLVRSGLQPGLIPPPPPAQTSLFRSQLSTPTRLSSSVADVEGAWGPAAAQYQDSHGHRQQGWLPPPPCSRPGLPRERSLLLLSLLPACPSPAPSSSVPQSARSHQAPRTGQRHCAMSPHAVRVF